MSGAKFPRKWYRYPQVDIAFKTFEAAQADGMKWAFMPVMIRASIPLVLLVLILGIPAITSGTAYVGQVLFMMLLVLFMGTLVDAFTNRVQDDH